MNATSPAGEFDYRQRAAVEFTTGYPWPDPPLPPAARPAAACAGFVLVGLVLAYAVASIVTRQPIPARRVLAGAVLMFAGLALVALGSMNEPSDYLTGA